jgi:hypothetical protein
MRSLCLVLALAACGGGGGGGNKTAVMPEDRNPAPDIDPLLAQPISLAGVWEVAQVVLLSGDDPEPYPMEVGTRVIVQGEGGGRYTAFASQNGAKMFTLERQPLEQELGFPFDWYENDGDGLTFDYGYGWDRLRELGGGGAFPDYVQYGVQMAAASSQVLTGYESEVHQAFLGEPRYEWVAQVMLVRVPQ